MPRSVTTLPDCGEGKIRNPESRRCVDLTKDTGLALVRKFRAGTLGEVSDVDKAKLEALTRPSRRTTTAAAARAAARAPSTRGGSVSATSSTRVRSTRPTVSAPAPAVQRRQQTAQVRAPVRVQVPAVVRRRLVNWIHRYRSARREQMATPGSPVLHAFCKPSDKLFLMPSVADYTTTVRLSYYIWSKPVDHLVERSKWTPVPAFDPKDKTYRGHDFRVPHSSVFPRETLRFFDRNPSAPLSLSNVICVPWFQAMNRYLLKLSNRERNVVFGYSNNSMHHINPFLIGKWKWDKFKDWASTAVESRLNPIFFQLKDDLLEGSANRFAGWDLSGGNKDALQATAQKYRDSTLSTSEKEKALYKDITRDMIKGIFPENIVKRALENFAKELQDIIMAAPPLTEDMTLYRGAKDHYFFTKNNEIFQTKAFISCTVNPQHALGYTRSTCCFQRLHLRKGSRLLWIGGNTFFPTELEFVLPIGSAYQEVSLTHPMRRDSLSPENVSTWCKKSMYKTRIWVADIAVATP